MPRKTKKGTQADWRKKAVELAKKIAKERDNYVCQKCGKMVKGANAHGSHVYSEGAYIGLSATVENIKCLCYRCHINWWHKQPMEAKDWFCERFPERHEYLLSIKNDTTKKDWQEVYNKLKELAKNYK